MTPEETKHFEDILIRIHDTRISKSADYGNSWKVFGLMGIVYQIGSKFIRIWNLVRKETQPANEPLKDSFKDLAVYAIMGLQLLESNETEPKI